MFGERVIEERIGGVFSVVYYDNEFNIFNNNNNVCCFFNFVNFCGISFSDVCKCVD